MQYTWQLALVLVPVYFIKHSVSCYIYYKLYELCIMYLLKMSTSPKNVRVTNSRAHKQYYTCAQQLLL